jgi:hypothetical protein
MQALVSLISGYLTLVSWKWSSWTKQMSSSNSDHSRVWSETRWFRCFSGFWSTTKVGRSRISRALGLEQSWPCQTHTGILILTSNRVGTFDEAFKSRIQLNLWYKNLTADQRFKIWENFTARLEKLEEQRKAPDTKQVHWEKPEETSVYGVDTASIRDNIQELASANLNGREIRNAISTARQLAMFKKEKMGIAHLRTVIQEAVKFDNYLLKLRRGLSADELQEEKLERLRA